MQVFSVARCQHDSSLPLRQVTRVRLVGAELRKWKEAKAEEARREAREAEAARVQATAEAEVAVSIPPSFACLRF